MDKLAKLISDLGNPVDGHKSNKHDHKRDLGKSAKLISDASNSIAGAFHKHNHSARSLDDGNMSYETALHGNVSAITSTSPTGITSSLGGTSPFLPSAGGIAGAVDAAVPPPSHPMPSNSSSPRYYTGLQGVDLEMDRKLVIMLFWTIFGTIALVFVVRLAQLFVSYIRNIFCMTSEKPSQQNYYSVDRWTMWARLKQHIIYAPLWGKRHNREIQLSGVINTGTLPSRIHTLIITIFYAMNITYCLILDWKNSERGAVYAELRGRSGILATVNMVPLVILAGRNNLTIPLLRVSFDTFNLFHRWIGRLVVLLTTVHVGAWFAAYKLAMGNKTTWRVFDSPFLAYGLVGFIAMLILPLHSLSPVRHAFYETFLHLHQSLAFMAFLGVYVHLDIAKLPAYPAILVAVLLWMVERTWRISRLIYLNYTRPYGFTWALVEALPGEACRVTFQLPRHITIRPGSHMYAYLPAISWWQSHPFSVVWTNIEGEPPVSGHDLLPQRPSTPSSLERQSVMNFVAHTPTSVSMVMVARTGMTRQLYNEARASPTNTIRLRGFLEGPYAGHDSLISYGTVVMFAGGGGITHHLIQIRHLIAGARAQTVATRRIVLVWSIRDVERMEFVKPWMNEILHMEGRREVLSIRVHVSKPSARIDQSKSKPTMQIVQGRCEPGKVLDEILPTRVGATMVSVCGPGALADEVRAAVRERIHLANIELNEESFTW